MSKIMIGEFEYPHENTVRFSVNQTFDVKIEFWEDEGQIYLYVFDSDNDDPYPVPVATASARVPSKRKKTWANISEWRAQGLHREIDVADDASEIIDADEPGKTLETLYSYAQYVIDNYGHHEDFLATQCDCLGYTEGPFRDFLPAAYEDDMGEELTIEELEDEGGVVFAAICGYMIGLNDDTTKKFTYLFLRTLGGPSWSGLEDLDFSVPDDLLENYERIISNLFCETFLKLANR